MFAFQEVFTHVVFVSAQPAKGAKSARRKRALWVVLYRMPKTTQDRPDKLPLDVVLGKFGTVPVVDSTQYAKHKTAEADQPGCSYRHPSHIFRNDSHYDDDKARTNTNLSMRLCPYINLPLLLGGSNIHGSWMSITQ